MEERREFVFEIKEIVKVRDDYVGQRSVVKVTSGVYWEDGNGEANIVLDDFQNRSIEHKSLVKRFIDKFIGGR